LSPDVGGGVLAVALRSRRSGPAPTFTSFDLVSGAPDGLQAR
jgi:hypothetical protein